MPKSHNFYGISSDTQAKIYDRKKYPMGVAKYYGSGWTYNIMQYAYGWYSQITYYQGQRSIILRVTIWPLARLDGASQWTICINFKDLLLFVVCCVYLRIFCFFMLSIREAIPREKCSFFEHCSKGLWPAPPFVWTSCRICSECREWKFDIMYLFYPQISPSMPQKSLFMQISCC